MSALSRILLLSIFLTLAFIFGCRKEEQLPVVTEKNVYTVWLFEKEVKIPLVNAPLLIYRGYPDTFHSDSELKVIRQLPPDTIIYSNSSARVTIPEKDTSSLLLLADNESFYSAGNIQVSINDTGFYYKTAHVKINFIDDESIINDPDYTLAFVNFYTLGSGYWPANQIAYGNFYADSIPGPDKSLFCKLPAGKTMIIEYWWSYNNQVPSVNGTDEATTLWKDTVSRDYYY